MGIEIFNDTLGKRIYNMMIDHALEHGIPNDKSLHKDIDKTHKIVEITRQATADVVNAEAETFFFRMANGEEVPYLFVAGILHAVDVINGGSIMGQDYEIKK